MFNEICLFLTCSICNAGQIKIWDVRQLSESVLVFNSNSKNLTQVSWCPTQSQVLASVGKDEKEIKIWDIGVISSKSAVELSSLHSSKPLLSYEIPDTISSFSWHPKNRYRMLAVSNLGTLHSILLQHSIPLDWSPTGIAFGNDKSVVINFRENDPNLLPDTPSDFSAILRKRAENGYCLDVFCILCLPLVNDFCYAIFVGRSQQENRQRRFELVGNMELDRLFQKRV